MSDRLFGDRRDAGRALAALLDHYRDRSDVLVLGLPRGGVPVAFEVAEALDAPMDVFTVRKLGAPGREELAMGAIASGGIVVVNHEIVRGLGIGTEELDRVAEREDEELRRRERAYRGDRPFPDLSDRAVLLVDDGLATGSTMKAAIQAAERLDPDRLVVAVPTAPGELCRELAETVDEVVCVVNPAHFSAVGQSYLRFDQTGDDEVRELLAARADASVSGRRPPDAR